MAVANAGSPQTQSEVKHAKGAKKNALDVFSKLLAGLTRKTKAGGEEAGEIDAEGLVTVEKNAKGKAKFPGDDKNVLPNGNEKIQNRDRNLLSALKGERKAPSPGELLQEAVAKKTKKAPEGEDEALLAAAEAAKGVLNGEAPNEGAELAGQDSLFAVADDRLREAFREIARGVPENAADAVDEAVKAESKRLDTGKRIPGEIPKKDKPTVAETRNGKKNKDRLTLEVQDLRTGQNGPALNAAQEINPRQEERVTDITVELRNNGRNQEYMELGREKSAGQAFEDILARELHQNLNGDIVRQASIMVRDGGEGTIRLSLKPEALGMVKIRLEMAENKITGHIIVESDEALRAFEKEIHALEQAFRDSGFEGASLDMALAGDGGQSQGQWNREAATPFFSPQFVSSSYDDMGETVELLSLADELNGFERLGMSRVNVLV